jgi:hypothetical protein
LWRERCEGIEQRAHVVEAQYLQGRVGRTRREEQLPAILRYLAEAHG